MQKFNFFTECYRTKNTSATFLSEPLVSLCEVRTQNSSSKLLSVRSRFVGCSNSMVRKSAFQKGISVSDRYQQAYIVCFQAFSFFVNRLPLRNSKIFVSVPLSNFKAIYFLKSLTNILSTVPNGL